MNSQQLRQAAAKELLKRRQERADSENLRGFIRHAWHVLEPGVQLKTGWAMDAIADHLQAVYDGDIPRLLINVPPGMSKSITTSVFWPAWMWTKDPSKRVLGTAHKQDLAVRDNRKCRNLITSRWYQRLWGDQFNLTSDQNQKTKFENDHAGFREAMAFTSLTGSRGDVVILDDPLSVDDARSPAVLQQVAETFTEALPSRLNDPEKSAIVVIMQRLHERDPSGLILEHDLGYDHLMLPMEFEPERRCSTSIGFTDPRESDGDLLFPERFPTAVVERDKKVMASETGGYAVAGQFQQRPVPRGGGMFKREWFPVKPAAPANCKWWRGWDLAGTADAQAAYTAGVKIGRAPDGTFWIGDATRGQLSSSGMEKLIVNTASQDGRQVKISLPQDPGQAGKAQAQYLIRQLAGFTAKASPESGDKATRAEPLSAQAEAGNVFLVEGPWNKAFLDEITMFPAGKFKDQVDAASRAFSELAAGVEAPQAVFGTYGDMH